MTGIGLKMSSLARLVNRLGVVWRVKYRGIRIASGVNMDIQGSFSFGSNCVIGKNAVITVPATSGFELGTSCYVGRYVEMGPTGKIKVGDRTSIQDRCVILGDVSIGAHCLFSYNVYISSGRHYFDLKPQWLIKDQDAFVAQDDGLYSQHSKPVVVEDDCWIGINVVVMPGTTIGKGAVIGANSVVTRDVEPYSVVAGAPARLIKKRLNFSPPKEITYSKPQDLPYFYSGFKTDQASILLSMKHEGVQAGNRFEICLDVSEVNSVHLILKGGYSIGAKLILNGITSVDLPETMSEVVFKIGRPLINKLRFSLFPENPCSSVIIQKAWVE